jgi:hypothetical protein
MCPGPLLCVPVPCRCRYAHSGSYDTMLRVDLRSTETKRLGRDVPSSHCIRMPLRRNVSKPERWCGLDIITHTPYRTHQRPARRAGASAGTRMSQLSSVGGKVSQGFPVVPLDRPGPRGRCGSGLTNGWRCTDAATRASEPKADGGHGAVSTRASGETQPRQEPCQVVVVS